jgi:glycosyltransferase involved in cell wall biosynthesis
MIYYRGLHQSPQRRYGCCQGFRYLPDNYKLAIIGGLHPASDDLAFYAEITDLIDELDLRDRVYITGFIKDDERLNSLIRDVMCVYPYDGVLCKVFGLSQSCVREWTPCCLSHG